MEATTQLSPEQIRSRIRELRIEIQQLRAMEKVAILGEAKRRAGQAATEKPEACRD